MRMKPARQSERKRKAATKSKEPLSSARKLANRIEATRKPKTDKSRSKSKERSNENPGTKNAHKQLSKGFPSNENDSGVDEESGIGIANSISLK